MGLTQFLEDIYGPANKWDRGKKLVHRLLYNGHEELLGWYDPLGGEGVFIIRPDDLIAAFEDLAMMATFHWEYVTHQNKDGLLSINVGLTTAGEMMQREILENIRNGEVYGDTAD